jgi:hypothetical protein
MEYEKAKAQHTISRNMCHVYKMNNLNRKIAACEKWLCEQRAKQEAIKQFLTQ